MRDTILVLNAGSSSVKFCLYDRGDEAVVLRGQIAGIGQAPHVTLRDGTAATRLDAALDAATDHASAIDRLLVLIGEHAPDCTLVAAGHRVVHGGAAHAAPVRVTTAVLDALRALIPLAPLHQPHNVAAIEALAARLPALPQVACFDTAFHRTQPDVAQAFALPPAITARAFGATASTACRTSTWRARCEPSMRGLRAAARSSRTSATAHRCVRWRTAAASRPRWASRRSTAW